MCFQPRPPQLRGRLAAEARGCFGEVQDALPRDAAKGVPADGTVGGVGWWTLGLRWFGVGSLLNTESH